jgi:hypothetical protein
MTEASGLYVCPVPKCTERRWALVTPKCSRHPSTEMKEV